MLDNGKAAPGPLVVSQANPRYFSADGQIVYLTGSHIWNSLQDGLGPGRSCADRPEANDFGAYLNFLQEHRHNFIRLWRWEHFRSQAAGGSFHLCMTPQPWARTGPGMASDGRPKFDLAQFDPAYFQRLRGRTAAAGDVGIYVAVMLFDGWALHLSPLPDNIAGHPFAAGNNINGIAIQSILDYQVLPLAPAVQALQEAYLRQVIDTLYDLPNVLYEVANELSGVAAGSVALPDGTEIPTPVGDSTAWQYWVIDFVRQYEQSRGAAPHPVGMTMQYPVAEQSRVNEPLFASPADWISPGFDDEISTPQMGGAPASSRWYSDPPASDGRKVLISDTDHYAPGMGDALWAWKSFLRGHNPILMDYGIIDVVHPLDPALGVPAYESLEPARYAMGNTLRFAQRINLAEMPPRGELSSTAYALANPGAEYLVLQPAETADPFSVTVAKGTYTVEWFNVTTRETRDDARLIVLDEENSTFAPPFADPGPVVLYLKCAG